MYAQLVTTIFHGLQTNKGIFMLERYMTEDSAWSGPNRDLPTREGGGADYLYRKCDFHGVGSRRRQEQAILEFS